MDYLTFGNLKYFILNLDDSLKNEIAKSMITFMSDNQVSTKNNFTTQILDSFINNINELRNTCAHNNRLLGFKCRADAKFYSGLHNKHDISEDTARKDFYSTFITLQCFTSKTEFAKLHNAILKSFKNLDKKISSIQMNNILVEYGFPNDWHKNTPKLSQQKNLN